MLCGIDEAGRGCICGSMFMCGVLGKEENLKHLNIKDSKMLSESSRQDLAYKLVELAQKENIAYHIVEKNAQEIDTQGLSACLKSALKEITEHLIRIFPFMFNNFILEVSNPSSKVITPRTTSGSVVN